MNKFHSDVAFNEKLQIGSGEFHIGNALSPLDFASVQPGPLAFGAGVVPPAGVYATQLDVSTNPQNQQVQPRSLVPHAMTALALVALLMVRR